MNNPVKVLTSTLLLFICFISLGFAQVKTLVKVKKDYTNIQKIEVSGGSLEVKYVGSNRPDVQVEAFLESSNPNQDIVFVSLGSILKISHKVDQGNWNNTRTKGYIRISGPAELALELKGGSGSILVENLTAEETILSVGSGSIKAKNIQGDLLVSASSGDISVEKVNGNITGKVSSGDAKIANIIGDVDFVSSSGGVSLKDVEGLVNIQLSSGNAKLDNIATLGNLSLKSGNLDATKVGLGKETLLSGTSGNFTIHTFSNLQDYNFNMRSSSGNITIGSSRGSKNVLINNGSSHEIKGSVSSGNISITY